jgi:hypothetical protein
LLKINISSFNLFIINPISCLNFCCSNFESTRVFWLSAFSCHSSLKFHFCFISAQKYQYYYWCQNKCYRFSKKKKTLQWSLFKPPNLLFKIVLYCFSNYKFYHLNWTGCKQPDVVTVYILSRKKTKMMLENYFVWSHSVWKINYYRDMDRSCITGLCSVEFIISWVHSHTQYIFLQWKGSFKKENCVLKLDPHLLKFKILSFLIFIFKFLN